jgi:Rrf2 family protein
LETDYAIRLCHILSLFDARVNADSLASFAGVSPRFALKILRKLSSRGLVTSYKGARGGYELSKPPGELTFLEVFEAVNGPLAVGRCRGEYVCDWKKGGAPCAFRGFFDDVESAIALKFSQRDFGLPADVRIKLRAELETDGQIIA